MNLSELAREVLNNVNCTVSEAARLTNQSSQNLSKKLSKETLSYSDFIRITDALGVKCELKLIYPNSDIIDKQLDDNILNSKIEVLRKQLACYQKISDYYGELLMNIRNNMSVITGCTDFAIKHIDDKVKTEKCLNNIRISNNQIVGLVNNSLDVNTGISDKAYEPSLNISSFAGKRILIVEDNEMINDIDKDILTDAGFVIEQAFNGQEAVEKLINSKEYYYDYVLMDINMPIMDGNTSARIIRNLDRPDVKEMPIIAVSASTEELDIKASLNAGMWDFIAKPLIIDDLVKILSKFQK